MELINGQCARKTCGIDGTESFYEMLSENPVELARLWRIENAKSLHIMDKDSMYGRDNTMNMTVIADITSAVDIPVEVVADYTTVEECRKYLDIGVFRVVISSLIFDDPDGVEDLIDAYTSSRVVLGIRALNRMVDFKGERPAMRDTEVALLAKSLGIKRIVYSDRTWEGTYFGPDIEVLRDLAVTTDMRITSAGGIDSPEELWHVQELSKFGVDSVVVGRALFENKFPCQKIWRMIEAETQQ